MRINFPNSNHINKVTGVLKKEFKEGIPKLSTQKLKNAICKSFGYQNYSDFQLNNSPDETPEINDVLLDCDLTSELDSRLSRIIVELLVSVYGFQNDEAKNITDEALVHTQDQRLTNASLDSIKDYIKLNSHAGYFGYDHWFDDADYDAKQLDKDSILIAADKLSEHFENWNGKDIKALTEPLNRLNILSYPNLEDGIDFLDYLPLLPINHLKNQFLINKLEVVVEDAFDNLIVAVDKKGGVLIFNDNLPITNGHIFINNVESMYQSVQEELEEYQGR